MNAIVKPIALGVAAYVISAVGFLFVFSFVLAPLTPATVWLSPGLTMVASLFVAGYVAARNTVSSYRARRISLGVIAGVIGFAIPAAFAQFRDESWVLALFVFGAAVVAAAGGFFGTWSKI